MSLKKWIKLIFCFKRKLILVRSHDTRYYPNYSRVRLLKWNGLVYYKTYEKFQTAIILFNTVTKENNSPFYDHSMPLSCFVKRNVVNFYWITLFKMYKFDKKNKLEIYDFKFI